MKLHYCPSCARVYFLSEDSVYLCGRNHAPEVWADGRVRRFIISERTERNQPPWAIPALAEERELLQQEVTETWLDECKNPDDTDFGDVRRHFGYGAPGGRHLRRDEVLQKYDRFVLRIVEEPIPASQVASEVPTRDFTDSTF